MATRIPAPVIAAAVDALGVQRHGDVAGRVQVPVGLAGGNIDGVAMK